MAKVIKSRSSGPQKQADLAGVLNTYDKSLTATRKIAIARAANARSHPNIGQGRKAMERFYDRETQLDKAEKDVAAAQTRVGIRRN